MTLNRAYRNIHMRDVDWLPLSLVADTGVVRIYKGLWFHRKSQRFMCRDTIEVCVDRMADWVPVSL